MRYVVGTGNYSMGDDSVGLRLIEYMSEYKLCESKDIELHDIANDCLKLLSFFNPETERILVIDCVKMGKEAGDFLLFSPHEVKSEKNVTGITTHEGDLLKTIDLARNLGYHIPEIRILGIEPKSVTPDMTISDVLKNRFDAYVKIIMNEIRR